MKARVQPGSIAKLAHGNEQRHVEGRDNVNMVSRGKMPRSASWVENMRTLLGL